MRILRTELLLLDLVDQVDASSLSKLLDGLSTAYRFVLLWESVTPDNFGIFYTHRLPADEELWVEFAEIGTPNKIGLRGKAAAILSLVTILGGAATIPSELAETYKLVEEAREKSVERDHKGLEVLEMAAELRKSGVISEDQYQDLRHRYDSGVRSLILGSKIVKSVAVLPPNPADRADG